MLVSCVTFICRIFCSCSTLLAPYWHARAQCEYKLIFALKFGNLALILPQTRIVVLNCNPITLNFLLAFSKVLQTFFSMKKYFFNNRFLLQSQLKARLHRKNGVSFVMEISRGCVPYLRRHNFTRFSYTKQMTHHLKL